MDPQAPPTPTTLLALPPDILTSVAHRSHPTARLVCTALAAVSPPLTAAQPPTHPDPATLHLALESLRTRHAHSLTALDLSHLAPFHPPAPLIAYAAALPHLASLTLSHPLSLDTPDATAALTHLFTAPHLTALTLTHCNEAVSAPVIHALATTATALRSLTLEVTNATLNGPPPTPLTALSNLQALTHLQLMTEARYLPTGPVPQHTALLLSTTARLPALQSLQLEDSFEFSPGTTTAALLARHTSVTLLSINFLCGMDNADDDGINGPEADTMAALGSLTSLRHLNVRLEFGHHRPLDACLSRLTALQSLTLRGMETPRVQQLPSLTRLTSLTELRWLGIPDEQEDLDAHLLLPLAGSLRVLQGSVLSATMSVLAASLTALTRLELRRERMDSVVGHWELPPLHNLRGLRCLTLDYHLDVHVASNTDVAAGVLGPLTFLTSLTLTNGSFTAALLATKWLEGMVNLVVLDLSGNRQVFDGPGMRVLAALPRLRELALDVVEQHGELRPLQHLVPLPPPALRRVRPSLRSFAMPLAEAKRRSAMARIHAMLAPYGISVITWCG